MYIDIDLCIMIYILQVWLKHSVEQRKSVAFCSMGEGIHTSCRRQSVHADCKRHSTILVCHSSAWLMIQPEQPGKEEVNLSSLSAVAALRRKSSMWSQCKRETSHLTVLQDALPRRMNQDYATQQQVWLEQLWANPATHKPGVIYFISRTQIIDTVIASQMRKLQHKKHLGDFLMSDCRATGSSQLFHTPRLGVP